MTINVPSSPKESITGIEIVESLKRKEDIVDDFLDNILSFKSNIIPMTLNSSIPMNLENDMNVSKTQLEKKEKRNLVNEEDIKSKETLIGRFLDSILLDHLWESSTSKAVHVVTYKPIESIQTSKSEYDDVDDDQYFNTSPASIEESSSEESTLSSPVSTTVPSNSLPVTHLQSTVNVKAIQKTTKSSFLIFKKKFILPEYERRRPSINLESANMKESAVMNQVENDFTSLPLETFTVKTTNFEESLSKEQEYISASFIRLESSFSKVTVSQDTSREISTVSLQSSLRTASISPDTSNLSLTTPVSSDQTETDFTKISDDFLDISTPPLIPDQIETDSTETAGESLMSHESVTSTLRTKITSKLLETIRFGTTSISDTTTLEYPSLETPLAHVEPIEELESTTRKTILALLEPLTTIPQSPNSDQLTTEEMSITTTSSIDQEMFDINNNMFDDSSAMENIEIASENVNVARF